MKHLFCLFISILFISGCLLWEEKPTEMLTTEESVVTIPVVQKDELIEQLMQIPRLSSFIMYKDGQIIEEVYTGNMNRNRPLNIKSASKNIISSLVGIAIDNGYIESVDDPISKYLTGYFQNLEDEDLRNDIRIRHLLTMSSGLPTTSFGNYGRWVASRDWVGFSLRSDLVHEPGTFMRYSTGDTHLLSAILTEATGMSTRQFAERYLFRPMNIRIGGWDRDPRGYFFGGNNMALSPGSLLAYGQLYLYNGNYNGQQLLSEEWVRASLRPYFERTSFNSWGHDYGYLWWRNDFAGQESWFAWGYGGQYMFLFPEMDAIVVLTADPDNAARGINNRIYNLMDSYIVPYLFHY